MTHITLTRRNLVRTIPAAALGVAVLPHLRTVSAGAQAEATVEGGLYRITHIGVRLRDGPGLDHAVVGTLNQGDIVESLGDAGEADGYHWRHIRVVETDATGYAVTDFMVPVDDDGWSIGDMVHVDTAGGALANLRAQPGLDAEVVATLSPGTTGEIVDGPVHANDLTWFEVRFGDVQGWAATIVLAHGPGDDREPVRVATGPLNVRSEPGLSGDIVATLPIGTTGFTTTEMPQDADGYTWVNVEFETGDHGWVVIDFLEWI